MGFYEFHEVVPRRDMATRRWIATFHDGTFEIFARAASVRTDYVADATPAEALDRVLGIDKNIPLDEDAALPGV